MGTTSMLKSTCRRLPIIPGSTSAKPEKLYAGTRQIMRRSCGLQPQNLLKIPDDLLPAAASLLKSLAVPDQPPAAASGVSLTKPLDALLRLAEIAPWDRSIWISLAEVILNKYAPQTRAVAGFREFTIPGPIAIAEAALTLSDEVTPMERMDPNSAAYDAGLHTFLAGIYLRSMPL